MKRNTLTTAVLAGLTGMAGMVSVSNAVNVNPDGTGQVLLYPYYTARGGNDTLISIVNTTERGKAVKIRFIEALNSREVLDFNIYMSPFDVWTAAITATDDGGAKMLTADNTCTVPYIFGDLDGEQEFLAFEFTGDAEDLDPASGAERTASGYIEVIEMGTMIEGAAAASATAAGDGVVEYWSKHVNGVPRNCDALVNAWTTYPSGFDTDDIPGAGAWIDDANFGLEPPSGGLFGGANIVNVIEGTMFSYNATALDGFWASDDLVHTRPDNLQPSLASSENKQSNVFVNGVVATHDWANSILAVNATITHDKIFNEYVTDPALGAQTEWVLTFPTKRFHTDAVLSGVDVGEPIPPFTRTWQGANDALGQACEDLQFRFWDREERVPAEPDPVVGTPAPPIVSPRPPAEEPPQPEDPVLFQLCQEANVIRFGSNGDGLPDNSEILGEPNRSGGLGYVNFELPYTEGWVEMDLANVESQSAVFADTEVRRSVAAQNGDRVVGLPVIGFAVTTFVNTDIGGGVLANYGGTFNHRGSRAIVDS